MCSPVNKSACYHCSARGSALAKALRSLMAELVTRDGFLQTISICLQGKSFEQGGLPVLQGSFIAQQYGCCLEDVELVEPSADDTAQVLHALNRLWVDHGLNQSDSKAYQRMYYSVREWRELFLFGMCVGVTMYRRELPAQEWQSSMSLLDFVCA